MNRGASESGRAANPSAPSPEPENPGDGVAVMVSPLFSSVFRPEGGP